jgi:uncharacterized membrane protein/predicted DsbA family dithiol-disulfide isomerase
MRDSHASPIDNAVGTDDSAATDRSSGGLTTTALDTPKVSSWLAPVVVVLCALGVAVSAELARIHVFVHTDPSYHSVCAMSEGVNCETVALSPHAVFLGLPVAVWGVLGYLVMGALGLSGIGKRFHPAWPWGLLLALASFSVLTSAILAFISATQIASLCLFCLFSYAINAALLGLALVAARQSRVPTIGRLLLDGKALLRHPRFAVGSTLTALLIPLGLELFLPRYWQAPGWNDLPRLPSGIDEHGHHWIGADRPRLTIVEFSDYECPHCRRAHKEARLLAAKHPREVRLVHRHLPLDHACHPGLHGPFHAHACRFAEAAECAGQQGRFWEMNDALFSTQDKVKAKNLDPTELAVRIGLARARFKQCMDGHATASRIADDVQESMARQLRGTPSFIIADQVLPGWVSASDLARRLHGTP